MNALKTTLFALALAAAPIAVTTSHAETPSEQSGQAEGGVYLQGLGGWSTLSGAPASSTVLDPALANISSGASLGWQPMESLRVELEYLYRNASNERIGAIAETSTGTLDSRSLMANALIDFNISDWATPYVGVGVGWTRVEPVTGFSTRDDVFAYQGIVGLSVPFSDTLSFFADGRFMRSDDFNLGISSMSDNHLQSWSALAGFRFTFGGSN
ncbi:outer membrane protein [Indioceanicola profundi]|uniref:outer membrane protein n=1 Tax=Indioceanicola profundi TaxID=2220096 RepID=UPI000E6AE2BC|nr:outer membrane beta-barrel protein [Indioceanicola profundi]